MNQSPQYVPGNRPHDPIGQAIFTDPERAAAFLRKRMPKEQADLFDWRTLQPTTNSFVDDDLNKSTADLVFTVEPFDRSRNLELVVLQENKSSLSAAWPLQLQLLKYFNAIVEPYRKALMKAIDEGKKELPKQILPVIVVFYHGKNPFNLKALDEWFGLDGPFAWFGEQLPTVKFLLCDLNSTTDEQLEEDYIDRPDLLTGLLLMKHIWNPNLKNIINSVFKHAGKLLSSTKGKHFFRLLTVYLGRG
ncbi:MAG: Rpn family recombination-promoting nuclease/putative transposase, partial [Cyanobacteria bacterium P01_H01_bin.74]